MLFSIFSFWLSSPASFFSWSFSFCKIVVKSPHPWCRLSWTVPWNWRLQERPGSWNFLKHNAAGHIHSEALWVLLLGQFELHYLSQAARSASFARTCWDLGTLFFEISCAVWDESFAAATVLAECKSAAVLSTFNSAQLTSLSKKNIELDVCASLKLGSHRLRKN